MRAINGVVISKIKGYYYVQCEDGNTYESKLKGTLKVTERKDNCMVGDFVEIDENFVIYSVKERKNFLLRPLVANIDQVFIQFSALDPKIDYERIQLLMLNAFFRKIKPVIIINKIDLISSDEVSEIEKNLEFLKAIDIDYHLISTYSNIGIEKIKEAIKGRVSAFGGPSGVGKSSLLNLIQDSKELKVGETSKKLKRGKHTTRGATLLPIDEDGGFVIDTPGFSSVELPPINDPITLSHLFPEFSSRVDCKFNNCVHINEPKCKIKEEVESGRISSSRYEFYKKYYEKYKEERWERND